MQLLRKDFNNSFWLATQYAGLMLLSFVGLKLNLLTFGADVFSEWLLLLSMWGVGSVLDLGFGMSTVKFVAMHKSDQRQVNGILSTSFFLFLGLGLCIACLGYGIAETVYFSNRNLFRQENLQELRLVCLVLGGHFYSNYLAIFFRSILEGFSEYAVSAKFSLLHSLLLFSCILVIYLGQFTLTALALSFLFTALAQLTLLFLIIKIRYPQIRIKPGNANMQDFRKLLRVSLSIQATYLLAALIDPVVKYIIGVHSDKKLIPSYEIARRFAMSVSGLFTFSLRNTFPKISVLKNMTDYKNFLQTTGITISRFSIAYSGFLYGVLSILFSALFIYFYKYEYCIEMFLLLVLVESTNNFGYILYLFIIGIGRTHFLILLQGLNLIFISLFLSAGFYLFRGPLGLIGLYFSVLISSVAMIWYLKKIGAVAVWQYYKNSRAWKLVLFHSLVILTFFMPLFHDSNRLVVHACLSATCFFVFLKDTKQFRNILPLKRLNTDMEKTGIF